MRTNQIFRIATLSLAALLAPVLVSAQQIQPVEEKPADKAAEKPAAKATDKDGKTASTQPAEPKLEKLEDSEPPSLKIGKPVGAPKVTVTEVKDGVKGREVKVESGKSTYYVRPNEQVGNSLPGDAQSSTNRGAEWKVMEFDLGSKKKKEEDKSDSTDGKK
jgi:hypothetical protein